MTAAPRKKMKFFHSAREETPGVPPAADAEPEELLLDTPVSETAQEAAPSLAAPPGGGVAAASEGTSPDEIVQAALARLSRIVDTSRDRASAAAGANRQFGLREPAATAPSETIPAPSEPIPAPSAAISSETQIAHSADALRMVRASLGERGGTAETDPNLTGEVVEEITARLNAIGNGEAFTPSPPAAAAAAPVATPPPVETASPPVAIQPPPSVPPPARAQTEDQTAGLLDRIAAAAAEVEQRLGAEVRSRLDAIERGLAQMQGHLSVTGERSREALEEMGRKVVDFDQALAEAQSAQRLNAEAIEQLTGEAVRINGRVEERLERLDVAQAQALEAIGADVSRIEELVGARLASVEAAPTAEALESLRGDVTRLDRAMEEGFARVENSQARALATLAAEAERIDQAVSAVSNVGQGMEERFARIDALQAHMLEQVNEKIVRMSERLAERIAATDWRSAQALEDVSERMEGVGEQLLQRLDQTTVDLLARVRQSEERTAGIFMKAVDDIESLGRAVAAPPPAAIAVEAPPAPTFAAEPAPEAVSHDLEAFVEPEAMTTFSPMEAAAADTEQVGSEEEVEAPTPSDPEEEELSALEATSLIDAQDGDSLPRGLTPARRMASRPTFGKAAASEPVKEAFWNKIGLFK